MKEFADRLKFAMEFRNVTASELSKKTNIDKSNLSRYLNGEYSPKTDKIYKIANALMISEAWLSIGVGNIDENYSLNNINNMNRSTDKQVILNYNGNDEKDEIIKMISEFDIDENDINIIKAVLSKYDSK